MTRSCETKEKQAGYALVVVLFALVILVSLFSVAQRRSIAHQQEMQAEADLLVAEHQRRDILQLVAARRALDDTLTQFSSMLHGEEVTIDLIDAAGFVDLNTGAPELIEIVVAELGLGESEIAAYRNWRREGFRLNGTNDFLRVVGAVPELRAQLEAIATTSSGRRGVAGAFSGPELVAALEAHGVPVDLSADAPTNVRFVVRVRSQDGHMILGPVLRSPVRDR